MAHTYEDRKALDSLLDGMSVEGLMECLSQIAGEKSSEIRRTWGATNSGTILSRRWERLELKFNKLARELDDPYYQKV